MLQVQTQLTETLDLTHSLSSSTPIYPGDPEFSCTRHTSESDGYTVHSISMGTHTGTHIDAPYHFFPSGRKIDQVALDEVVGLGVVFVDLSVGIKGRQRIGWDAFASYESQMKEGKAVLVHTGWWRHYGDRSKYFAHPFFDKDVAEGILDTGARLVAFDTPNPDCTPFDGEGEDEGYGFHEAFLGRGGLIVESVNLGALADVWQFRDEELAEGQVPDWSVSFVPLRLDGCDGSPVRAFVSKRLVTTELQ